MSVIDSTAVFAERIIELGLSAHVDRFVAKKWFTLANLAYASNAGSSGDEDKFISQVVIPGLGRADHPDLPTMRRLYFEAFMLSANELRQRTEAKPEGIPREVPAPERRERRQKTAKRLVGLNIRGNLEPSNRLIDRCLDMVDSDAVVYLPLELCTKRELEVQKIDKDPFFATSVGQDGSLRLTKLRDELVSVPDCQYGMSFAWQRRGIALDTGDVMAYETHELLHQRLVNTLMKDPQQGFSRVSIEQVLEADARAFMLLA